MQDFEPRDAQRRAHNIILAFTTSIVLWAAILLSSWILVVK